jgi:catechol 2,3-dioxygenase-like lactoylglutathione lyase family enzyme
MIDHVSIAVRDLDGCARFYEAVLATLGHRKLVTSASARSIRNSGSTSAAP